MYHCCDSTSLSLKSLGLNLWSFSSSVWKRPTNVWVNSSKMSSNFCFLLDFCGKVSFGQNLIRSWLIAWINSGFSLSRLTRISLTKVYIFSSFSWMMLLRVKTSSFFLILDYYADTIFLNFCLSFTLIPVYLAVLSFSLISFIFFSALWM